jgi:Holliday junction resolvase RusA-like endonuclease
MRVEVAPVGLEVTRGRGTLLVKLFLEPVAKGRPRITTRGGFARAFTPQKTRDFEAVIRTQSGHAMEVMNLRPLDGACRLTVRGFWPCPKSAKKADKARERLKTTRPDGDNVLKAAADAINEVMYLDDSQAAIETVEKWITKEGGEPRVEILVESLEGEWE